MDKLTVIENSLIPVYQSEKGTHLVNARELHEFLGVGRDFSNWIKDRIERYGFIENQDFIVFANSGEKAGRPSIDYIFKLEPAKEIAMVENNEKGKQIRRYFIQVEEKFKQSQMKLPTNFAEACRMLADEWEEKQILLPKAQAYDVLMNTSGTMKMNEVAKLLDIKGVGQNNLFKVLVLEKIIYKENGAYLPYQKYKDHFIVKQNPVVINGEAFDRSQLFMTAQGVDWLARKLVNMGYQLNHTKNKSA